MFCARARPPPPPKPFTLLFDAHGVRLELLRPQRENRTSWRRVLSLTASEVPPANGRASGGNAPDTAVSIVLLVGPPGSGKGTQCEMLADAHGWGHISSGELFRAEIARQTPLGRQLATFIDGGALVPDALTVDVVLGALDAMTADTVLLDGFPRTLHQAHALLDRPSRHVVRLVIELEVPEAVSVERLVQRSRSDDDVAAIHRRLALYESQTRPALDWLNELEIVVTVDGDQPPDAVRTAIEQRLSALTDLVDATGSAS
jgi:adenylate kinase